jgi:uncharacterized protein involved in propanediol utilization
MKSLHFREPSPRCVSVTAQSHAGEILQGAVTREDRTRRVLVSLPAPSLTTMAVVRPTPGRPLSILPERAFKTKAAVHRLIARLGVGTPEAEVRLTTNIPRGKGCGSSTTDILAAVRAVLTYLGVTMTEESVAKLMVEVEEASDSTVLSRPVVFRHREGVVEEYLPSPLPCMRVFVLDTAPARTISTTAMPRARYSAAQLRYFDDLIKELRTAVQEQSAEAVGWVATESALINEQYLPKPGFRKLLGAVMDLGGYGLAAAHSGTVLSAIFPDNVDIQARDQLQTTAQRLGMDVITDYLWTTLRQSGMAAA